MFWLYLMLMGYCALTAIGFGYIGMESLIPAMAAIMICLMAFFFTMLKASSYLFGFREYDMLMALPFSEKDIVASKFLYMYMKDIPWNLSISVAMMLGYALTAHPAWYVYPLWIVLTVFVPVIPMLLASFVGYLIAKIGTNFKHWKMVQTILTLAFVMFMFSIRFIMEKVFRDNGVEDVLEGLAGKTQQISRVIFPVGWFTNAVTKGSIISIILLVGGSIVLFEVVFSILAKSYKKINSTMKTGTTSNHAYKVQGAKGFKKSSPVQAIAFKELRRFFGSTNYFVNVGFGYIIAVIAGIASLFIGLDRLVAMFVQGAPVTTESILPLIPYILYFFTGMVPMTTCSPSLEGKNYWIIKSSPVSGRQIYLGKILASLAIAVPTHLLATLLCCMSARATLAQTAGFLALGLMMCLFSSVFGCAMGIHFLNLDWENEIDIIKRGTAVPVYMFPNMILTVGLAFGSVFLAKDLGILAVVLISIIIYTVLTAIFSLMTERMVKAL